MLVDDQATTGTGALPPVRVLARSLGVSLVTAWKAVRHLCDEGLLVSRKGRGTYVAHVDGQAPSTIPAPPRREPLPVSRWERVRDRILTDFVSVHGPSYHLPSCKVLASRYGASYRTVRKALADLEARGRVTRSGKAWRPAAAAPTVAAGTVVLVVQGTRDGRMMQRYPNEHEVIRQFEKSCSMRGVRMRMVLLDSAGRGLRYPSSSTAASSASLASIPRVVGAILWLTGSSGEHVNSVIHALPPGFSTVAVGIQRSRPGTFPGRTVAAFDMPDYGYGAGAAVGQCLLEQGHRRVVCVFPASLSAEGTRRFEGVADTVSASAGGAVCECRYVEPPPHPFVPEGHFDTYYREYLDALRDALPGRPGYRSITDALWSLGVPLRFELIRRMRRKNVARAIAAQAFPADTTAIVTWNDECALACRDALRARGMRIPEDLSLISFDDTIAASTEDIASYNFNSDRLLQQMLDWVLWPNYYRSVGMPGPVAGYVAQRGSLRPV